MPTYYSCDTRFDVKRLNEKPVASEWDEDTLFIEVDNGDIRVMEEDGEWALVG
jgi:hypothetical protein